MFETLFRRLIAHRQRFLGFFNRQPIFWKVLLIGGLVCGVVFTGASLLFLLVWSGALGRLPGREELQRVEKPVASEVYSADSVLLGRYFIQERSDVQYEKIPAHVVDALLATEDVRYYKHRGVDYRSLGRVLFKSLLLQSDASGGGSTLTQQLAKNLYPRKQYVLFSLFINKMREMLLASRLEDAYDKEALIALYLNTVPFGDNTYGIESASQRFYSIPVESLTIEQGAVLVGMLKATYSYNPRLFPERSTQRRNVVLGQMSKYGMLSVDEAQTLMSRPLALKYNRITHHSGMAPYFREYLRAELLAWCRERIDQNGRPYNLYTDGLKIYTTIDSRLQYHAETATSKQMSLLQATFQKHWGKADPWHEQPNALDEAVRKSVRYENLLRSGWSHSDILEEMKKPVPMTIFTWQGEREVKMSPLDSVRHYLKFLNAGVLGMDPRNGAIRIWVGGINHHYFQFDHVRESTKRQVGSVIKPIVYAAALEAGHKPCDYVSAAKTTFEGEESWTPANADERYDLKYSMEGALAYSVNTAAVHMLEQTGIDNTIQQAHKMGISSDLPAVPSLALGTPGISVMEMITAYSCIANKGKSVRPYYISSIVSRDNVVLDRLDASVVEQALSENSAMMLVQMLKRSVDEGTAAGIRSTYGIKNDMAGKTGTTQSNADGWFIAITPNLVVGAWVGADDPRIRFRTTALGQGARTALPIVAEFFKGVNADRRLAAVSQARFPELPPHLSRRLNCDLYKSDTNVLEKIFGKKEKDSTRVFGEKQQPKKKGFLKRLFGT